MANEKKNKNNLSIEKPSNNTLQGHYISLYHQPKQSGLHSPPKKSHPSERGRFQLPGGDFGKDVGPTYAQGGPPRKWEIPMAKHYISRGYLWVSYPQESQGWTQ